MSDNLQPSQEPLAKTSILSRLKSMNFFPSRSRVRFASPEVQPPKKKRKSMATKTGLIFPVNYVLKQIKKKNKKMKVQKTAAVYCAAILEYLSAEVLELAVNDTEINGTTEISPRNIQVAVRIDPEVAKVFKDVIIPEGGTASYIDEIVKSSNANVQSSDISLEVLNSPCIEMSI